MRKTSMTRLAVFDQAVLILDDVATRVGCIQELRPRFQAVLLPADVAVRAMIMRRRTDLPRAFATCGRLGIREHGSLSFRVRVGHSGNAPVGAVRSSGPLKKLTPKRCLSQLARKGRKAASHPSLKSVHSLIVALCHTGSPPSLQPHLRRRTRGGGADSWRAVVRLGWPGVVISGRSPHFWTEKYPGRTLRSKSCRISRKSTAPQAREPDALSIQACGGSGGPRELGRPAVGSASAWSTPRDEFRWPPNPGRDSPGRVRQRCQVQELRWDGRRLLPYGQATRTEAISATED